MERGCAADHGAVPPTMKPCRPSGTPGTAADPAGNDHTEAPGSAMITEKERG
jgi:hypothetical protein